MTGIIGSYALGYEQHLHKVFSAKKIHSSALVLSQWFIDFQDNPEMENQLYFKTFTFFGAESRTRMKKFICLCFECGFNSGKSHSWSYLIHEVILRFEQRHLDVDGQISYSTAMYQLKQRIRTQPQWRRRVRTHAISPQDDHQTVEIHKTYIGDALIYYEYLTQLHSHGDYLLRSRSVHKLCTNKCRTLEGLFTSVSVVIYTGLFTLRLYKNSYLNDSTWTATSSRWFSESKKRKRITGNGM